MPLAYDDIDGSWGIYSKAWPRLTCGNEDEARRAFIACTKGELVPYGSYVLCDLELRVERQEYLEKLTTYLDESPHKTYAALRDHFIATGQWLN